MYHDDKIKEIEKRLEHIEYIIQRHSTTHGSQNVSIGLLVDHTKALGCNLIEKQKMHDDAVEALQKEVEYCNRRLSSLERGRDPYASHKVTTGHPTKLGPTSITFSIVMLVSIAIAVGVYYAR